MSANAPGNLIFLNEVCKDGLEGKEDHFDD